MGDTYFYATTFEAGNTAEADEIAQSRDLDPPQGPLPTVVEVAVQIATAFAASGICTRVLDTPEICLLIDQIIEIVTSGNVPAGSES